MKATPITVDAPMVSLSSGRISDTAVANRKVHLPGMPRITADVPSPADDAALSQLLQPIHKFMQSPDPLPQNASCACALSRFLSDDSNYALPVVDARDRPVSLIERKAFIEYFSKMYVREIFSRRSIQTLLAHRDYNDRRPLVIEYDCSIAEVGQIIIRRDIGHVATALIVSRQGRYAGIANGHEVLRAITQSKLHELTKFNAELETRVATRTAELNELNKQLESFSYTIAHDLRAPVRAINGFSEIVLKSCASTLDSQNVSYLNRVVAGSRRMGELIDDLLNLARLSRQTMTWKHFDLSAAVAGAVEALSHAHPDRSVTVRIQTGLTVLGDPGLVRALLDNLIGNAWKFTAKVPAAMIEFGAVQRKGVITFFVRDNGAGFDMRFAHKLFEPFQRLHHQSEFEGTGIGLATVKKIVQRHRGTIAIESAEHTGTTVYFTLGDTADED